MIRKPNLSSPARLALSSFVALLTLALTPALAAAIPQYEEAIQGPCGSSCNPPQHHEGAAHSSKSPDAGGSTAPSETGSHAGEGEKSPGAAGGSGSNPSGGGGEGVQAQDNGSADANPSAGGDAGSKSASLSPTISNASSDDGGSSPLVPILIVVAVLAAISLGVVWYRQRKQRPGTPSVSPKAG
jgi:cobalamin biosynthesis Mg chelatase CobN